MRRLVFLPLLLPVAADRFDRLLGAGDDGRGRAVDRGDRELLLFAGDRLGDLCLGGLDRRHRPACGQGAHQPAPGGDELCGVGQIEDAGDVGGGDLADRVAGEDVGLEAALAQRLIESYLDREQGGLGVGRCRRAGLRPCLPLAKTISLSGVSRWRSSSAQTASKASLKRRSDSYSSLPMPSALGALAGEEVGELAVLGTGAEDVRRRVAVGQSGERREQLLAVAAQHDRAVLEGAAGAWRGSRRRRSRSSSGFSLRWAARRSAASARAGSALAERTRGIGPGRGRLRMPLAPAVLTRLARARLGPGASSRITWALVPLMPKEETPARRGRPLASHGELLGQQLDLARLPVDLGGGGVDVQGLRQHALRASPAPS